MIIIYPYYLISMESTDIEIDDSNTVMLGFAEPPEDKYTFSYLDSKIGGLPTWLVPLENKISPSFFKCSCGKNLTFLLQIYSPLEDNINCFHRILYVFFCSKCWKTKDIVKVLRLQLKENSSFYKGEKIINKDAIENDKTIQEVNKMLSNAPVVLKEYFMPTDKEKKKANQLYLKFYSNIDEKSFTSTSSVGKNMNLDLEEDDLIEIDKSEKKEYNELFKQYCAENPNIDINKIETEDIDELESDKQLELNSDLFFKVFSAVVNHDKTQVVRYYRNDFYPLWFSSEKMLSIANTKCKNCGGEVEFEFQIMPYLFNIEPQICGVDIGTIVIYTCKNSCCRKENVEGEFIEEYGFIQRTGEDFNIEGGKIQPKEKKTKVTKNVEQTKKEEEVDEEGFVEVKKKRKK